MITYPNGRTETPEEAAKYSVPDGWYDLVVKMLYDLLAAGWDGQVFQIKEKFGGLRLYVNGSWSPELTVIYDKAESDSFKTCVKCGAPGEMFYDGWISPYCEEHMPPPYEEDDEQ